MTAEERKLWYEFLKSLPNNFYRQKIIERYIVDFCCPSAKIVIELDGGQHYDDKGIAHDKERDDFLRSKGYKVLRYSNRDINQNFKGVCEAILLELSHVMPSPSGSPSNLRV
ncbi:MAG: endonuclease domain-containing protein [Bacteroides sp.]|nr:endonuclease domain-containing protein [Bacillota bacterium]MCM1393491.1 endonuclease domain-containing protein [[Eubacterium] siraeum]MCM1456226.1 endonuclease domain-containing protein [Bacteroides sp.]